MANDISTYDANIRDWVNANASSHSSTAKGDAFCQWCLENIFELSSEQALDAMEVSGAYDHSIDAIIETDEKLIVVQTKYDKSHSLSAITDFRFHMERIKQGKLKSVDANDNAQRAAIKIQAAYLDNLDVKYYYITNASFTELEKSKLSNSFENDITLMDLVVIVAELERRKEEFPSTVLDQWFALRSSSSEILRFADTTAVLAVSLAEIHDFVNRGRHDLYASNVRQYLRGTKINKGIKQTIEQNPGHFWIYNNGITIVCDDFREEHSSIEIKTPQIVNGCQTAESIWEVLSKKSQQERSSIPGHVLVKVIKGANIFEKQNITRYTNTQNAVRGKDFYSLDLFQQKLRDRFASLGYYYEIQRGSYVSLKKSEKAKYAGIPELVYLAGDRFKNMIPASEAVHAYVAGIKQMPSVAYAKPYELTPNSDLYKLVNDDGDLPQPDVRFFLYPYLIREWAKRNGYSRGGFEWRAHSVFYFIYTYYLIAFMIIRQLGLVDELETSPSKVPAKIWDKLFYDAELNEYLLHATDALILERFFEDYTVEKAVGQDVRGFLKNQLTLDRHKLILESFIEKKIFRSKDKSFLERIEVVLRA